MRYPHIGALLFDQPWLITSRALESMIERVESTTAPDLEAVAAKLGRPLENTGNRVETRNGVGILEINGPIFRYANLFAEISGATSVEMLARDFQVAMDNPAVEQILLRVDSAGGEVSGIHDLAQMIRGSRKPVTAFIDGLGASAAYWLASAADKVFASASSFTGSIGAVATLTDRRGVDEKQGKKTYQIVSSQSPRKVLDPATEDGQKALQEIVDSIGALFVESVAANRGVTTDKVLSDFGRGNVLAARPALAAGLIDGITTEEELITSLSQPQQPQYAAGIAAQEDSMNQQLSPAVATTTGISTPTTGGTASTGTGEIRIIGSVMGEPIQPGVVIDMAQRERERIQGILTLPEAEGRAQLAQTLAFEAGMTVDAARRILAASPTSAPVVANSLDREMARIGNPKVGAAAGEPDTAQMQVDAILACVPAERRARRIA